MKKLLVLALLAATPALAQRGPANRPLQNYAETCTVYGSPNDGDSCAGVVSKSWCVNYTSNIIYACSPSGLWEAVASGGSSGGGGFDDWGDFSGFGGTVTAGNFLVGGSATFAFTGGGTVTANGVSCTDCVTIGTETIGSYAAGDAEAGNATGLACSACVSPSTELSAATSAVWTANVSDETGTGAWVFGTSPTLVTPTLTGFTASRCARFNASGVLVPSTSGDCDSGDTGGGGGDSILVGGTNVTDGTGINFLDAAGIDLTFDSGVVPDTLTVGLDLTETNDPTFGDDTDSSNVLTVRVASATDVTYTHTSAGVTINTSVTSGDQTAEPGNGIAIFDNDTSFTNDPTCANSGAAGMFSILDKDEGATDTWCVCNGTAQLHCFTSSTTATHALFATATAGAPDFRAIATTDFPSTGTWTTTGAIDAGGGSVEVGNGPAPTCDADGEICVDTSAQQMVYDGGAAVQVLDPRQPLSVVLFAPTSSDDPLILKAPYGMTITDIDCIVGAATSAQVTLTECDATNASCSGGALGAIEATITCDTDGAADAGGIDAGTVAAGNWLKIDVGTVTGTVGFVSVTVLYTIVRE